LIKMATKKEIERLKKEYENAIEAYLNAKKEV